MRTNARIHKPTGGWVVLLVKPKNAEPYYKIFGIWKKEFPSMENWRLSSGSNNIDITVNEEGNWIWPQASGSVYVLNPENEGDLSYFGETQIERLTSEAAKHGCELEIVKTNFPPQKKE